MMGRVRSSIALMMVIAVIQRDQDIEFSVRSFMKMI